MARRFPHTPVSKRQSLHDDLAAIGSPRDCQAFTGTAPPTPASLAGRTLPNTPATPLAATIGRAPAPVPFDRHNEGQAEDLMDTPPTLLPTPRNAASAHASFGVEGIAHSSPAARLTPSRREPPSDASQRKLRGMWTGPLRVRAGAKGLSVGASAEGTNRDDSRRDEDSARPAALDAVTVSSQPDRKAGEGDGEVAAARPPHEAAQTATAQDYTEHADEQVPQRLAFEFEYDVVPPKDEPADAAPVGSAPAVDEDAFVFDPSFAAAVLEDENIPIDVAVHGYFSAPDVPRPPAALPARETRPTATDDASSSISGSTRTYSVDFEHDAAAHALAEATSPRHGGSYLRPTAASLTKRKGVAYVDAQLAIERSRRDLDASRQTYQPLPTKPIQPAVRQPPSVVDARVPPAYVAAASRVEHRVVSVFGKSTVQRVAISPPPTSSSKHRPMLTVTEDVTPEHEAVTTSAAASPTLPARKLRFDAMDETSSMLLLKKAAHAAAPYAAVPRFGVPRTERQHRSRPAGSADPVKRYAALQRQRKRQSSAHRARSDARAEPDTVIREYLW